MPYLSDAPAGAMVLDSGGHEIHEPGGAVRPRRLPGRGKADTLQEVAAVMRCGALPLQFVESIDAGNRQLGNRAFMHWVAEMRAAGREGATHAGAMQGLQGPNQSPDRSAPLQCMPKKHRKKEPDVERTPQEQTTRIQGGEKETAVAGEKKKKKKSRVQVALNTLRLEGVEAFRDYLEAEVDETALLDTLTRRVQRAQDLAGVTVAALDAVQARLRALDPMALADLPQAPARDPEQVVEGAVAAAAKTSPSYREIALYTSCRRGNARQLESLLRFGKTDINVMTPNGTLLYIAALENYPAVVKVLLSRPGIDVNLAGASGATPLFAAAQYGHLEVVRMLLQRPEINPSIGTSNHGTAPLTAAAFDGRKEMVKLLLSSGKININLRQKDGATALFCAVQRNWPEVVGLLIRGGADVNLPITDGTTPLCVAAFQGYIKVLKLLLQVPGTLINQSGADHSTPLFYACYQEHEQIVRALLKHGADPDMPDYFGMVALHFACIAGNTKIVELLLNNKAGPDLLDATGLAAIHIVCFTGHTKILEMLLDAGADTNLIAQGEFTPYRVASIAAQQEVMNLLEARSRSPAGAAAQLESLPHAYPVQGQAREEPAEQTTPTAISTVSPPQTGAMSAGPTKDSMSTTETVRGGGAGAGAETDGKAHAVSKSGGASQTAAGSQPGGTETGSLLEQAKLEFRQDILMRLKDERIDPLDGIRLLEAVNRVADLHGLCAIYNHLAGIERTKMRTRNRPLRRKFALMRGEEQPHEIRGFILGDKANLDAEAVEAEIRRYLAPAHHKFISQAVNDMEFGRGKPTTGYPGLLHASAGIAGVGSCSIFYYPDADRNRMRIVGLGHHAGRSSYRLGYSVDELSECARVLRIA